MIFNSYLDITRGYPNHLSHAKTIKNVPTRAGEEQPGRWGTRICPFGAAAARTRPRAWWNLGGWNLPKLDDTFLDCLIWIIVYHDLSCLILVGKNDPNCCWWFYPKSSWISGSREVLDTQDHLPPSGVHDSSELGITTAASLEILVEWIGHGWSSFRI